MNKFRYGIDRLSVGIILDILKGKTTGYLDDEAKKRINLSKDYVEKIVENDKTVYGINTGFGPLCTTKISDE